MHEVFHSQPETQTCPGMTAKRDAPDEEQEERHRDARSILQKMTAIKINTLKGNNEVIQLTLTHPRT